MVGCLPASKHFKAHACLAAYMSILKRNLSATWITSQSVMCDVMAVEPISVWHCWCQTLLKKASN